ncbi:MAG: hypothetical protein K9W43_03245 [Candidatus Thorarchaeota archaeon]|nr:hypothetical protein [Candidatus Thorarchaeota archaeon]
MKIRLLSIAMLFVMILTLLFPVTPITKDSPVITSTNGTLGPTIQENLFIADAGGQGQQSGATVYFTQDIPSQTLSVLNTYATPATHNGNLDLTPYLIPGWTLYKVEMNIDNITATAERQTLNVVPNDHIKIENNSGYTTDALYQAFYYRTHDGKLLNYTLGYMAPYYDTSLGKAWLVVRSDYSNPSTNISSWISPFTQIITETTVSHDVSSDNTILNASSYYYVVIDGTAMTGTKVSSDWYFNKIYWDSQTILGVETGYHGRDDAWRQYSGIAREEAELNYTYVPWNKTESRPIVYSQPTEVSLSANSTSVVGDKWLFTSVSNITQISFSSNQSVNIYHNLTLWYKQDVLSSSTWSSASSGGNVDWNITSLVLYPQIAQQRYLNLTKQVDWTTTGFYNGTDPTNHSTYTTMADSITVSTMTNGTWTLTCTAPNYVTEIITRDSVSITDNLLITNTIQDTGANNATTGSTNLTIWQDSARVAHPANETVVNGATTYTWDIDSDTTNNGTYRIEVYWANGTEAGYLTREFIVYYPTTLTSQDASISTFTDSSFDISVYFNETFTPKALDGSYAGVSTVYSFDGSAWTSMTDQGNGTWTATISTAGFTAGTYQVRVNGSGYAIENQSITIDVTLTYDTLPLVVAWSNTDNISYTSHTNLTVQYNFVNGTHISEALVTVTDYTHTWTLQYDSSGGYYWLQFNGTDAPGLGTHTLNISASKTGYESQYDSSQSLSIYKEPTSITVTWTPANVTIPYTDSLNLQVDYTYGTGDVPSGSALVNVTIDGVTYPLTYIGSVWNVSLAGSDLKLGIHTAYISAWSYGYAPQSNTTSGINITLAPNSFIVIWENPSDLNATYTELVNITVIYTYDSDPVPGATVRLYLNSTRPYDFTLSPVDDRWHLLLNASDVGLGKWNATILANRTGYDTGRQTDTLTVVVDVCTAAPNWSSTTVYYTHTENLDITVLDSFGHPVTDALVNATYRGSNYNLTHVGGGIYRLTIDGHDGMGAFNIQVWTWRYGLVNHSLTVHIEIVETPISGDLLTGFGGFDNTALYHDGWVIFTVTLRDVDNNSIVGMTVNLTTTTTIYHLTDNGDGTYQLNLTGYELGIVTLSGNFTADLFGYDSWKTTISLDVEPVPTRVDVIVGTIPTEMYLNQTIQITLEYVNTHTNALIDPTATTFTWAGSSLTYSEPTAGRFSFTLSAVDLAFGAHNLYISLSRSNYSGQVIDSDIIVRAVHTEITTNTLYQEYENETIRFTVEFRDTDRNLILAGRQVNVTISGSTYMMHYDSEDESYYLDFLIVLSPGSYTITFAGAAPGYDRCEANTTLIVNPKAVTTLTIELVGKVVVGAPVVVRATLTEGTHPIIGATVYFHVMVFYSSGDNVTSVIGRETDEHGVAELTYIIPTSDTVASSLAITAEYRGTRDKWRADSIPLNTSVEPDIGTALTQLFATPPGWLLLALVAGSVVTGVKLRRRRASKRAGRLSGLKSRYDDFLSLNSLRHFMIVYKDRGTCIFYHPFGEHRIHADLISGFISAMTSMYGEIKGSGDRGALEEIGYAGLRVASYNGDLVIGILIAETSMTPEIRKRLQNFVKEFEKEYKSDLTDWTGLMDCFDPEWIVSTLYSELGYQIVLPHTIRMRHSRLSGREKKLLSYIQQDLESQGKSEFRVGEYLDKAAEMLKAPKMMVLDMFIRLEEINAIQPIDIATVLQRQGHLPTTVEGMSTPYSVREDAPEAEEASEESSAPDTVDSSVESTEDSESTSDTDESVEQFVAEVERLLQEERAKDLSDDSEKSTDGSDDSDVSEEEE